MPTLDPRFQDLMSLDFPQSLAVYDNYEAAQEAVDYLADEKFPVKNLCIVGTDLRLVERVLGPKNWGTVLTQGVINGLSMGLLFGLMWMFFSPPGVNQFAVLLAGVILGMAVGVIFAGITYAMSGRKRDFQSIQQTIATKYEVLCEHKHVEKAREMLNNKPGERARAFE